MKIGTVQYYYAPNFSGAAVQFHRHAQVFVKHGCRVTVFTPHHQGLARAETLDGINIIRLPTAGHSRTLRQTTFYGQLTWALLRYQNHYDVLHWVGFGPLAALPAALVARMGKRNLYQVTIKGGEPHKRVTQKGGLLTKFGVAHLHGLSSLSDSITEDMRASDVFHGPIRTLGYGVDSETYRPPRDEGEKRLLRSQLGLVTDATYITFVGSVVYRKGVDILIDAFEQLAVKYPELHILLLGRDSFLDGIGNESAYQNNQAFVDELKKRVLSSEYRDRVKFIGLTQEVPLYMRASDLFVFPSRREGFGAVILEAMATGLPIIISELDGISDRILADGHEGIIVRDAEPISYANSIESLLRSNRARILGLSARQKVEDEFSINSVALAYLEYYDYLLNTP